jgi:beta-lactamase regulating signal transducer with metallopeptidase domain
MNSLISWINSVGISFVAFNLLMLLQSGILILVLLFVDRVLRKRVRAVLRYWIWLLVLVKLVLPPGFSLPTSPSYWLGVDATGIVSQRFSDWSTPTPAVSVSGLDDLTSGLVFSAEQMLPKTMPIGPGSIPVFHTGAVPSPNDDISAVLAPELTPYVPGLVSLQWRGGVFLTWLAVVILALLFLLRRWLQVKKLISVSKEPDQSLVALLEQCRRKLGVRACIRLRVLPIMGSPSVCGLFRPTILIPHALLGELDQAQLRSVLLHELAHIKRGDLWCSLAQTMLQIVYFYNALLWLANCVIRTVREKAVDEMVLVNLGEEADDYPRTLLSISQMAFRHPMFSLRLIGVVESKKELIGRIRHMANRPVPTSARLGLVGMTALAVLAATLLPMAKARSVKSASDVFIEMNGGEAQHERSQPTFTDRDASGQVIRQWGFEELRSRDGNALDVSQPFMNLYLDDLTCKISADDGRLRQETGRDRFPKGITFSGNVAIQFIPESDSPYSLEAETISIDLADNEDSQAITLTGGLEHMEAHGGVVKLGVYTRTRPDVNERHSVGESQAGDLLGGAELWCQRIVYDPNSGQGVFRATGPGDIRYHKALAQGTGELGAQQKPCYAFLKGFEVLEFCTVENRMVASANDRRMQFEYFPIADGQGKQRIYAEAKHVEIELTKTPAGKLGLGTLAATGDVYYEDNGKDAKDKLRFTANSLSYNHRQATLRMWSDMNEPCTINGTSVKGIQYNLQMKDLQTQSLGPVLVGPKAWSPDIPAGVLPSGSTPSKLLILPHTRLVSSSAPDTESYIQAYVTLADESGARFKYPGTFRFELYEKRPGAAAPRGKRTNIWPDLDLTKAEQNNLYWQDFLRTYEFRLDFVPASNQKYFLQATFLGMDGKRLSATLEIVTVAGSNRHENVGQIQLLESAVRKSAGYSQAQDIALTIDATIQQFAHEAVLEQMTAFEAESAWAVVADPKTGAVLAMVSLSDFESGDAPQAHRAIYHHATETQYEPGSIMKPFVVAIALDAGVIARSAEIFCEDGLYTGREFGVIKEYNDRKYERLSPRQILIRSSNIGMAKIGQKLGSKRLYDGLRLFGFGEETGMELPGEAKGLLRDASKWDGYSITRIPFGQEVAVTAMQMVKAFCILANEGRAVQPHLIKAIVGKNGETIARGSQYGVDDQLGQVLNPEIAKWLVTRVLTDVVNEGTGRKARLDEWQVFGKTGTAQIAGQDGRGYEDGAYIASFIGGAPSQNPAVIVLVSICRPKRELGKGYSGGTVAAPVVGRIMEKTLAYLESRG